MKRQVAIITRRPAHYDQTFHLTVSILGSNPLARSHSNSSYPAKWPPPATSIASAKTPLLEKEDPQQVSVQPSKRPPKLFTKSGPFQGFEQRQNANAQKS